MTKGGTFPRRKRFSWIILGIAAFCVLVLLPLGWLGYQYIGPWAAGPIDDPIVAINAERAGITPNAATLYEQAFETFFEPGFEGWKRECGRDSAPLAPELVAWLGAQSQTVSLAREATAIPNCFFLMQRDEYGGVDWAATDSLKKLARLLAIRARHAAEQRDVETLADSLVILNAMARHAFQRPTVVDQLVGIGILSLVFDQLAVPYTWPDRSPAERTTYAHRIAGLFEPPPSLDRTFQVERDECCWMVETGLVAQIRLVSPAERIFGEFDRHFAPYYRLAAQPVEQQAAAGNQLVAAIRRAEKRAVSQTLWKTLLSPARAVGRGLIPAFLRTFELRFRTITLQRGYRTIITLFAYADEHARFPESLDLLAGDFKIDPYTGQPFIYRVTEDGFILYSAAVDHDDDSGQHSERFGEKKPTYDDPNPAPDGDYVFWPLPD